MTLASPPRNALNTASTAYMGDVLRAALREVDEVQISVSFLRFSGLSLFLKELQAFLARGGRLRMIVSTYLNVSQPGAIAVLASMQGVDIRLQIGPQGFHTKYYMFGRGSGIRTCWVGSSNFTKNGLFGSVEWNTRHDEAGAVAECEALFAELWERSDIIPATAEAIASYERTFMAAQARAAAPLPQAPAPLGIPEPNAAQREALAQLAQLRADGARRAAVIAATGVGKTLLAAFDAVALAGETRRAPEDLSVLFIAHRHELLEQARQAYARVCPGIETGLLASGQRPGKARVVFATVQSLLGHPQILARAFDQVVVDEFHHADAPSYRQVLDGLTFGFLLGLTATPERSDGRDVLELCDYNVAYEVRLAEAIDRGWLIPFHYFGIPDTVDYAPIPWRNGKFDPSELESALVAEERTDLILRHALEKGFDGPRRATVGFCAGVRHANYMARTLENRGYVAAAVTGEATPAERQQIYARFENPADPLEWLFVADVLNEGVDLPAINSLLFLRPTESPGLFLQQLGRGLRHHPDTEVLTVLDFVGHHKNALVPLRTLGQGADVLINRAQIDQTYELNLPQGCVIVLEDQTEKMLLNLQNQASALGGKEMYAQAYCALMAELGQAPVPADFRGRSGVPEFRELRKAFGSWIACRQYVKDADDWEVRAQANELVKSLLGAAETDFQFQRVAPYAALWALVFFPENSADGMQAFFERFGQWRVELDLDFGKALASLGKKMGTAALLQDGLLVPELRRQLTMDSRLADEVERRMIYTLACDHRKRHGGVLRTPADLVRYHGYLRHEVVNYLGVQYDPARHNTGVVAVGAEIALLAQLNTSDARARHQYQNGFSDDRRFFSWQSQNQMVPNRGKGQDIVDHRQRGLQVHLFVQPRKEPLYFYLGAVAVESVQGSAPFTAALKLPERLPELVEKRLAGV